MTCLGGLTGAKRATAPVPDDFIADGPLMTRFGVGYLDGRTPSPIAFMKNRGYEVGRNPHLFGDWREEVVLTSRAHDQLIILTTDQSTDVRLYTLAQNPAYRNGMTLKGYLQSHAVDHYLGTGMTTPPAPDIHYAGKA